MPHKKVFVPTYTKASLSQSLKQVKQHVFNPRVEASGNVLTDLLYSMQRNDPNSATGIT